MSLEQVEARIGSTLPCAAMGCAASVSRARASPPPAQRYNWVTPEMVSALERSNGEISWRMVSSGFDSCYPYTDITFTYIYIYIYIFSAFHASLLLCFTCFFSFLLLCFTCFFSFLLLCFPCFSAFVLLRLSTSTILTFSFLQSCVFAALLPAPLLLCFLSLLPLCFFLFFYFILSLNETLK